jgi:TRAP-type C4-dicarboxylate transport system permease small subunit
MYDFLRFVRWFSRFLNRISEWALAGMMGLTCADVVLRGFRHPILGTYEIVGLLGAIVIAFSLSYTTLKRGHVAVEALVRHFPLKVQGVIYFIVHLLSILLFILIAYECWRYGLDLKSSGEVSLTLKIPYYPIMFGISFSAIIVCLVLFGDILLMIFRGPLKWYYWEEE